MKCVCVQLCVWRAFYSYLENINIFVKIMFLQMFSLWHTCCRECLCVILGHVTPHIYPCTPLWSGVHVNTEICNITYWNLCQVNLTQAATSRLWDYANLNINYGSKTSNRLNVESQRFWENPPQIIRGDLKCSSSQTTANSTDRQVCICVCVCVHFWSVFVGSKAEGITLVQDILE